MRCRALVVSVILIGAASAPAAAQIKLDMNKITLRKLARIRFTRPGFRKVFHERLLQRGRKQ